MASSWHVWSGSVTWFRDAVMPICRYQHVLLYNESFTCGKNAPRRKNKSSSWCHSESTTKLIGSKNLCILWLLDIFRDLECLHRAYTFDSKLDDLSDNFASNIPCGLWDETRISQRMSELKPSSTFSQSIHTHRKESLGCLRSLHLKSQGSQSLQKSCNFSKPWQHTDVKGSRIKLLQTRRCKSGRTRLCIP